MDAAEGPPKFSAGAARADGGGGAGTGFGTGFGDAAGGGGGLWLQSAAELESRKKNAAEGPSRFGAAIAAGGEVLDLASARRPAAVAAVVPNSTADADAGVEYGSILQRKLRMRPPRIAANAARQRRRRMQWWWWRRPQT
jgi:hypothetical protein